MERAASLQQRRTAINPSIHQPTHLKFIIPPKYHSKSPSTSTFPSCATVIPRSRLSLSLALRFSGSCFAWLLVTTWRQRQYAVGLPLAQEAGQSPRDGAPPWLPLPPDTKDISTYVDRRRASCPPCDRTSTTNTAPLPETCSVLTTDADLSRDRPLATTNRPMTIVLPTTAHWLCLYDAF
jgi:hypothetical protein